MKRIDPRRPLFSEAFARWHSLRKAILAIALIAISGAANAVRVDLVSHQVTDSQLNVTTYITDGSHTSGISPASDVTWDWDGMTLTSTGFYGAVAALGSNPLAPTVNADQVVDLVISTDGTPGGTGTADGTSYVCVEGTFLPGLGASACGGYLFGANYLDESTTVWGPGLEVSQTIGGDDVLTVGPRTIYTVFGLGLEALTGVDGLHVGDQIILSNGLTQGETDGAITMTFEVRTSAVDDSASGPPGIAIDIPVLANDALLDDITALSTGNFSDNGSAVVTGSLPGPQSGLSLSYTSDPAFVGDETFEYTVTDASGSGPVTATVRVTVTDQPVANDDGTPAAPFAKLLAGSTRSLDVLANDNGLADTPLTVVAPVNTNPTLGTVAVTGSPGDTSTVRIEYTAGAVAGMDAFGYQVSDNGAKVDNATVFVEVTLPSVPVAVDDAASTFVDQPVTVDLLANDTGLADTPLTVTITGEPANGSVANCKLQGTSCVVEYTPDTGFIGSDTFQYMVTDSTSDDSNIATVTITVDEVPIAVTDPVSTTGSNAITIDVLANDAGLSFTPLVVTTVPNPAMSGTAVAQTDNTIVYTPRGSARSDTFQYTVTDANGNSAVGRVTVTIVPDQDTLPGQSSAVGPVGFGLLFLLCWLKRRRV